MLINVDEQFAMGFAVGAIWKDHNAFCIGDCACSEMIKTLTTLFERLTNED